MKKVFLILGVVFFILISLSIYEQYKVLEMYSGYNTEDYKLQGQKYHLLVADTPQKMEKGLMYYRKLNGVDGMIFKFPRSDYQNFWNKNTLMDLTLYWINNGEV